MENQENNVIENQKDKVTGSISADHLKNIITKIERLEEEKANIMEDIREVYAEAKAVGFDAKTVRKVVKIRKMDTEKLQEEEYLLDLYRNALGL
ncbi:MAG: DUF2312 domain-containing protein [Rickettsiales bacterium]